jgi:hypothetical protein
MQLRDKRDLACAYLEAKHELIEAGFAPEFDWQADIKLENVSETDFLREAAWVILSSGMRESVVRSRFAAITRTFLSWRSAKAIHAHADTCRRNALRCFAHQGKIDAVLAVAEFVSNHGFIEVKKGLEMSGPEFLRRFPFLGPVTSLHLAKNLGFWIAKPDRHLCRLAASLGTDTATLCEEISHLVPDSVALVDLVLWRYATVNGRYLETFRNLIAVCAENFSLHARPEHLSFAASPMSIRSVSN